MLEKAIFFVDIILTSNYVVHFVYGVAIGFLAGYRRPLWAFWSAFIAGLGKEFVDYFKHRSQIEGYSFMTHPAYGINDAILDMFFWMLGGYIVYRILTTTHKKLRD
jgi:hypothetical protein